MSIRNLSSEGRIGMSISQGALLYTMGIDQVSSVTHQLSDVPSRTLRLAHFEKYCFKKHRLVHSKELLDG
jgi:hypothetical protein